MRARALSDRAAPVGRFARKHVEAANLVCGAQQAGEGPCNLHFLLFLQACMGRTDQSSRH
eukprot:1019602-Pyramimonas_sp.AAC.1